MAGPDDPAISRGSVLVRMAGSGPAMTLRRERLPARIKAGARTDALDYRLAPEYPFPAALEDALSAHRALIAMGASPSRMIVAGDSAGGGLALALLLALRDAHDPLPAAAILFSPRTDLAATGESILTNNTADALFFGSRTAVRQLSIAIIARRRAVDSDALCRSRKAGPKWRNTSATSSPSRATKSGRQAGTRSGTPGMVTLSDSSGLAVAQTLLVAIMRYRAVVVRLR